MDDIRKDTDAAGRASPAGALTLETFLPYRLNVAATQVSEALSEVYSQRYGFGIPEWRVLATLGQFGVLTATAIGDHSRMHKTKVSRAVKHLADRGYLARKINRADLREAHLSLTAAGQAVYADLAPIALAFERRLTAAFTPEDHAAFDRIMRLIGAATPEREANPD